MACSDPSKTCKTGAKSCKSTRCCLIGLAFVVGFIAIAVCVLVPKMVVQKLPTYIHENISTSITIGHADIGFFPPAIYFHDVRFKNPEGFTEGDAMHVARMVAHVDGFWSQPLIIRSITVQGVSGTAQLVNEVDNFTPILQDIMSRSVPPTKGWASKHAVVETIMMRQVHLKNPDGTVAVDLDDANLGAIGTVSAPVTVHDALRDSFKTIVAYEQSGIIPLMAKGVGNKMQEKWEGIKDAVRKMVE